MNNNTKTCTKCGVEKELTEFHKHKLGKYGMNSVCKDCKKIYTDIHKQERNEYSRLWFQNNKDRIYRRNRCRKVLDPKYNLRILLSNRIGKAISKQYGSKSYKTLELIGCTITEVKLYLESQFTEGMTWDNYGMYGWHIDHIKPCSSFDLTDPEQQKLCFHYTNLQPLWAKDNLSKGDKLL